MYAFEFQRGVFTPDGKADIADVDAHNKQTEAAEIEYLKAGPPNAYLYARLDEKHAGDQAGNGDIQTFLGTKLCRAQFSERKYVGFGHNTYRRAVACELFGVKYFGWYMESSGDYVRLRRAKRQ